jgi:hypothetical protein
MNQFNEIFKNSPRFNFNLFLESHETTGKVSIVLDEDLSKNIQRIVNVFHFLSKIKEK